MRRASQILRDLGFNSQSSAGSQDAFLRHLEADMKRASAQNSFRNSEQSAPLESVGVGSQLTFDPEVLGVFERRRSSR